MPPRREDLQGFKKKQTFKQEFSDLSFDTQLSILLPYLKMMPLSMQSKFVIPLKQMLQKQVISQMNNNYLKKLLAYQIQQSYDQQVSLYLIQLFCRFLKLNKLKQGFTNIFKKNMINQINKDNSKQYLSSSFQPFEPRNDKNLNKIQPIPSCINPNYQNIIKMFKTFTNIHINTDYKPKQLNQTYTLYSQPRFINKLLQVKDLQSNFQQKGNIILMNFQGTKITGKRGFAFINQSIIYWWQKNYNNIKQLLPQLGEQKNKNTQGQFKNQSQTFKFNQNFKLSFKMIGHHGKITTISLSDDQYYLLSAGTDKVIKLWCLRQKNLLAQYRGHTKTIWSVSFCKSGYFFLSGSADNTMKLWSTDDSMPQRIYVGHNSDVVKVDFLTNPDLVVSGSQDKTLRIWNTLTTQCLNIIKLNNVPISIKSSLSGRYLLTCDFSGKISVYDLLKGQKVSSFMVPQKLDHDSKKIKYLKIHDICLSMDEKQFACISSKYIILYSFDKICQKQSKNVFVQNSGQTKQRVIATKEVIYTGRDTNLVYSEYLDKGILFVASTCHKKY